MQTKTINLYSFDELSKDAQKKAITYFQELNTYDFLTENLTENLAELLTEKGWTFRESEGLNVFYDLSYSQGSGAMFTGNFYLPNFPDLCFIVLPSGRDTHENSKTISIDYLNEDYDENFNESFAYDSFNSEYVSLCLELQKRGYDYIEAEDDPVNVRDMIISMDYLFTENGKLETL